LPLPLGRRLPSDRKVFESQNITGIRKSTIADAAIIPPMTAQPRIRRATAPGLELCHCAASRRFCSAALGICKCLMKPSSMQHCASRCPNGLGDVWYYEVFMDVENRPNEGRRLPRFRYREISRRAVVANLRKLDQYGVVTMFRMRLLLDLKKGPLQWKR
jgi:hypothetical protein